MLLKISSFSIIRGRMNQLLYKMMMTMKWWLIRPGKFSFWLSMKGKSPLMKWNQVWSGRKILFLINQGLKKLEIYWTKLIRRMGKNRAKLNRRENKRSKRWRINLKWKKRNSQKLRLNLKKNRRKKKSQSLKKKSPILLHLHLSQRSKKSQFKKNKSQ